MGHAQRKVESVQGRTLLPPPLPMRSGIAPKAVGPSAPALHKAPLPRPVAALEIAHAPKSPLPAADLALPILPQWADASAPLLPAKKRFGMRFWIIGSSVGLAAGALVAAGLIGVHLEQRTPQTTQPQPVAVVQEQAPLQPTAAKVPDMEFGTEEAFAHEDAVAAPVTVLVPEVTVTTTKKPVKQSAKRAKVSAAKKSRSAGPKAASVVATSWQPDTAAEAEDTSDAPAEAGAATSGAASVPAAEQAPEPVAAPEPPKPVLPEQLTREQVRKGMESKRHAVIACAKGAYGKVLADITIAQSGAVSSSVIEGTFAGTSVGSCMSGALRSVQFPAFSGPEIQVRYPFSF